MGDPVERRVGGLHVGGYLKMWDLIKLEGAGALFRE